jgi:hypothetical protein
MNPLSLLPMM